MASELDYNTLWSGLSASRVFDWHDSHFWLLFYADVAAKLRQRVASEERRAKEVLKGSLKGSWVLQLRFLLHLQMRREQRCLVRERSSERRLVFQVSGVPKLINCDARGTGPASIWLADCVKGCKTKKSPQRFKAMQKMAHLKACTEPF